VEEDPTREVLLINTREGRSHRSLTQETLKVPRVEACEVLGEKVMTVSSGKTAETWITPYQRYLANSLLPDEPTEAKAIKRNSGKYTMIDGNLFHYVYTRPALICICSEQCARVMSELHEGIYGLLANDEGRLRELRIVM